MFESGAIIEYLIDKYDKDGKLSYTGPEDEKKKYLSKSWLHFQMSGQGPYFGTFSSNHIASADRVTLLQANTTGS